MSPELQASISIWRQKAANGTLTQDEMKKAILALRADRVGAQIASDKSRRAKAKVEIPSAQSLLDELGGL